jgi:hypothetical protein
MKILGSVDYPVHLIPGNKVVLKYGNKVILDEVIEREMSLGGAIVFELEPGDLPGIEIGVGGALIRREQ